MTWATYSISPTQSYRKASQCSSDLHCLLCLCTLQQGLTNLLCRVLLQSTQVEVIVEVPSRGASGHQVMNGSIALLTALNMEPDGSYQVTLESLQKTIEGITRATPAVAATIESSLARAELQGASFTLKGEMLIVPCMSAVCAWLMLHEQIECIPLHGGISAKHRVAGPGLRVARDVFNMLMLTLDQNEAVVMRTTCSSAAQYVTACLRPNILGESVLWPCNNAHPGEQCVGPCLAMRGVGPGEVTTTCLPDGSWSAPTGKCLNDVPGEIHSRSTT